MAKRIEITSRIQDRIRATVGEDIDYNNIVVYEACAASTRPLSQQGSPYDKAVMTQSFLMEMANYLPEGLVTLQVMHENQFLPIGRIFAAEVYAAEHGHHELNVLFYLEQSSEYVSQIELAIIDEVSIGALPEHALCSECGFDFRESYYSMMYGECENGHIIGEDGCHLRITKLEKWKEVSLVNRGASNKPKILGQAKQRLGKEELQRLAASGDNANTLYLFASSAKPATPNQDNEESNMDPKVIMELSSENGRLKAVEATLNDKLTLADTKIADQDQKITELTQEISTLKASDTSEKVTELESQLVTLNDTVTSVTDTLRPQYALACTAAGLTLKEDATVEEMCAAITDSGIKLAAVPRGQVTDQDNPLNLSQDYDLAANHAFVTKSRK